MPVAIDANRLLPAAPHHRNPRILPSIPRNARAYSAWSAAYPGLPGVWSPSLCCTTTAMNQSTAPAIPSSPPTRTRYVSFMVDLLCGTCAGRIETRGEGKRRDGAFMYDSFNRPFATGKPQVAQDIGRDHRIPNDSLAGHLMILRSHVEVLEQPLQPGADLLLPAIHAHLRR